MRKLFKGGNYSRKYGIPFLANGVISSDKVEQVMKSIDRGDFCKSNPYNDAPQGIGYGVTISAPHMVN